MRAARRRRELWRRRDDAVPGAASSSSSSRVRRARDGVTGWLLLNKCKDKARAEKGERRIDLENFVRDGKKGEVLWTATFDSKPSFGFNEQSPPAWAANMVGVQVPASHPGFFDARTPSGFETVRFPSRGRREDARR